MDRYFVDERCGCIAVRDREKTDPGYPGLNYNTTGVVKYWGGTQRAETCPACGQRRPAGWEVPDAVRQAAVTLCAELNQAKRDAGRGDDPSFLPCIEDTVEYILRGPGRKTVNRRIYCNALALHKMLWQARDRVRANSSAPPAQGGEEKTE